jgi:hypothetical protein
MKQKNQVIVLIVLSVIAILIFGWQYWSPSSGVKSASSAVFQGYQPLNYANPEIQFAKVAARRKAEYKGEGINPFSNEGPKPPVVVLKVPKPGDRDYVPPPPPPPPPAPELPASMKFFGYGNVPNNTARRAFLSDGDEIYIVGEGDTLVGRFRILKINNSSLEFEEVASGRRGQKVMEDPGPTA